MEQEAEHEHLRPPSKEEIKRQLLSKTYRYNDYLREYEKNRKEAIKEILKENVKTNTGVKNTKLQGKFAEGRGDI